MLIKDTIVLRTNLIVFVFLISFSLDLACNLTCFKILFSIAEMVCVLQHLSCFESSFGRFENCSVFFQRSMVGVCFVNYIVVYISLTINDQYLR